MLTVEWPGEELEATLRRGDVICPGCGAALNPWGYAQPRTLRRNGVIGAAIEARAQGVGYRAIVSRGGAPAYTARRWRRRLSECADGLRRDFATLSGADGPTADAPTPEVVTPGGNENAVRVNGCADSDLWAFAALATKGRLLCNTS